MASSYLLIRFHGKVLKSVYRFELGNWTCKRKFYLSDSKWRKYCFVRELAKLWIQKDYYPSLLTYLTWNTSFQGTLIHGMYDFSLAWLTDIPLKERKIFLHPSNQDKHVGLSSKNHTVDECFFLCLREQSFFLSSCYHTTKDGRKRKIQVNV